jgi:hypothetical protein
MAKRIKKIPQKIFETREDFQYFIENEKEWMYSRIVEAIRFSFEHGYAEAKILEAKIEESMSSIAMNSEVEDWDHSLSLALKWYESQENYEECASILKLIDDIRTVIN